MSGGAKGRPSWASRRSRTSREEPMRILRPTEVTSTTSGTPHQERYSPLDSHRREPVKSRTARVINSVTGVLLLVVLTAIFVSCPW